MAPGNVIESDSEIVDAVEFFGAWLDGFIYVFCLDTYYMDAFDRRHIHRLRVGLKLLTEAKDMIATMKANQNPFEFRVYGSDNGGD